MAIYLLNSDSGTANPVSLIGVMVHFTERELGGMTGAKAEVNDTELARLAQFEWTMVCVAVTPVELAVTDLLRGWQ